MPGGDKLLAQPGVTIFWPLNGKKNNILKKDFIAFGMNLNIVEKVIHHSFASMTGHFPQWQQKIENSFLSEALKQQYQELIAERLKIINAS